MGRPWMRSFAQARASVAGIETPEQMRNAMSPMAGTGPKPDLWRMTGERLEAALVRTTALVERAQARGEISGADPADLARRLRDGLMGTSLAWALTGERPVGDELAETVERLLAPYRNEGDGAHERTDRP